MKPTRGLPASWIGSLPRERRLALSSVVILFVLLGAVVLYQRYQTPVEPSQPVPAPVEEPPMKASIPPSVPDPAGSAGMGLQQGAGTGSLAASQATPGKTEAASAPGAAKPAEAAPERLSLPLAGHPSVLKPYGSLDPAYGDFRIYPAIAYEAKPGQPVLAAARGRVATLERDAVDGLAIVLEHSGGMSTRYTGLAQAVVKQGDLIEAGSIIARTGEPGPAHAEMGPHLGFAVLLNHNPVDPGTYLPD